MKKKRRGTALLLSIIMLLSAPVASYAEEPIGEALSVPTVEQEQIEEEGVFDGLPFAEEEGLVAYNLGTHNVFVGQDAEFAEEAPGMYELFESDGSYTIQLEDDAFFPYEVQFTYDGQTVREWFETPESTVEVNGHTFRVASNSVDAGAISRIGIWVGDRYIAAYPEEKEFSDFSISVASLLPLTEREVTLDLSGVGRNELSSVKIATILSKTSITTENAVVWMSGYRSTGESRILQKEDTLNLLESENKSGFTLIVGDAKQLNSNNIRYLVRVENMEEALFTDNVAVYTEKDSARTQVETNSVNVGSYTNEEYITVRLDGEKYSKDTYYIGGLRLATAYEGSFKIYEGKFKDIVALEAALAENPSLDVTNRLMATDMTQTDAGYAINESDNGERKYFTTVMENGTQKTMRPLRLQLILEKARIIVSDFKAAEKYHLDEEWDGENGVTIYKYFCKDGCSASSLHQLKLAYKTSAGEWDSGKVTKAVVGIFDTLEAASEAPDIKDELFGESRRDNNFYEAYFSGDGVDFTVFAEGAVYKLRVIAQDDDTSVEKKNEPNQGSCDTYFNITGAEDLSSAYVMSYKHDSYFDMGYQTVLYLDEADSSTLKPTFVTGDGVRIYSGHNGSAGTLQTSGETVNDFSTGAVQYAAASENGQELKNYWVTFLKKQTGGAKLFVNGLNGADGATREVFLTSATDCSHDIFIANIGDQPLTGLTASLQKGDTVALDEYWTVGGESNGTLAAFTTTAKTATYGELPNVAKIRLLEKAEGEIDDYLTISADGQEDVVIHLTGHAGDPRLMTEEIPEAVKYVPYGVQILYNNKYDWNKVTMELVSGSLPEGVTLKSNGEIYGVPKETGTFEFSVRMNNSYSGFDSQKATYILVVQDNTNENVEAKNDTGYSIEQRVGTRVGTEDVVTEYKDALFVSEGEMGEFVDFWLNGEKLTEGADYSKKSGSTRITIRGQTFKNKANNNSKNTIAMEFRVDGDTTKDLKRTSQNFTLQAKDSGSSGSSHSNSRKSKSSATNQAGKASVAEQPIVEAVETIVDTVAVPVAEGVATAETEALQKALNSALEKDQQTEKKEQIQIVLEAVGLEATAEEVKVIVPEEAVAFIAKVDNASMKLDAGDLGSTTLSHTALQDIADAGEGDLSLSLKRAEQTMQLELRKGEKLLSGIDGGVKVAFDGLSDGEVIVLIQTDGVEKIVKKSVVTDGNVYAWIDGSGTVKVIYHAKEFEDVAKSDWFYDAVVFANSRELFVGVSDREFAPNLSMSRAMLAAVLHRLENNEAAATASGFQDVLPNRWYSNDVAWAEANDIISGYGNGLFGVEDKITIEQLAVILYRYANYIGLDTTERGGITKFQDAAEVSAWANDAVRWAVGTGLLSGDGTNLNAKAHATRAQVAAVMIRFVEKIVK